MSWFEITASVECIGIFDVKADSEEEARRLFEDWVGDDEVEFSHYSWEAPSYIISVENQDE